MGATRAQRGLPPPGRRLSGAPEKTLPKELRRLSAKLMANRSDRHLLNLSNSQGTKARSPDQEKVRGFPSWPGVQRSAPAKGRIHDRNRIKEIRSSHLAYGAGSIHESSNSYRSASQSRGFLILREKAENLRIHAGFFALKAAGILSGRNRNGSLRRSGQGFRLFMPLSAVPGTSIGQR